MASPLTQAIAEFRERYPNVQMYTDFGETNLRVILPNEATTLPQKYYDAMLEIFTKHGHGDIFDNTPWREYTMRRGEMLFRTNLKDEDIEYAESLSTELPDGRVITGGSIRRPGAVYGYGRVSKQQASDIAVAIREDPSIIVEEIDKGIRLDRNKLKQYGADIEGVPDGHTLLLHFDPDNRELRHRRIAKRDAEYIKKYDESKARARKSKTAVNIVDTGDDFLDVGQDAIDLMNRAMAELKKKRPGVYEHLAPDAALIRERFEKAQTSAAREYALRDALKMSSNLYSEFNMYPDGTYLDKSGVRWRAGSRMEKRKRLTKHGLERFGHLDGPIEMWKAGASTRDIARVTEYPIGQVEKDLVTAVMRGEVSPNDPGLGEVVTSDRERFAAREVARLALAGAHDRSIALGLSDSGEYKASKKRGTVNELKNKAILLGLLSPNWEEVVRTDGKGVRIHGEDADRLLGRLTDDDDYFEDDHDFISEDKLRDLRESLSRERSISHSRSMDSRLRIPEYQGLRQPGYRERRGRGSLRR